MKACEKKISKFVLWTLPCIFMLTVLCSLSTTASASDKTEAQSLIDKSRGTITNLMSNDAFSGLKEYLKTAKGVIIFPQVLKAGFFWGGSGGTGVLLVHDEATGNWSEPAFYTVGSVTFGFQIGGEAAEMIMVATNQKALDSLFTSTVKLGGDTSIAIGPVGGGAKGSITVPAVTADFVSFSKTKGLYAGLNLEGSVLGVRDDLNSAYYGKKVTPKDILEMKVADNSGANELRLALKKALAK